MKARERRYAGAQEYRITIVQKRKSTSAGKHERVNAHICVSFSDQKSNGAKPIEYKGA